MRSPGQIAEKRVLKSIKARPQPRSGGIAGFPHDGVKGRWLIEIKSTQKRSIRIESEWLEKLFDNAIFQRKLPALIVSIEGGYVVQGREWVMIPRQTFDKLGLWEIKKPGKEKS